MIMQSSTARMSGARATEKGRILAGFAILTGAVLATCLVMSGFLGPVSGNDMPRDRALSGIEALSR